MVEVVPLAPQTEDVPLGPGLLDMSDHGATVDELRLVLRASRGASRGATRCNAQWRRGEDCQGGGSEVRRGSHRVGKGWLGILDHERPRLLRLERGVVPTKMSPLFLQVKKTMKLSR